MLQVPEPSKCSCWSMLKSVVGSQFYSELSFVDFSSGILDPIVYLWLPYGGRPHTLQLQTTKLPEIWYLGLQLEAHWWHSIAFLQVVFLGFLRECQWFQFEFWCKMMRQMWSQRNMINELVLFSIECTTPFRAFLLHTTHYCYYDCSVYSGRWDIRLNGRTSTLTTSNY